MNDKRRVLRAGQRLSNLISSLDLDLASDTAGEYGDILYVEDGQLRAVHLHDFLDLIDKIRAQKGEIGNQT